MRRLAGNCYLALRTQDGRYLSPAPTTEALRHSGLAGMYANLCARLDVAIDKRIAINGMQLSLANGNRWHALTHLLASLQEHNIEPVLFKGGVLHARWPVMRDLRTLADYDLIVPLGQLETLQAKLARDGFDHMPAASWLVRRLTKGSMVWKGDGLEHQNLDIHAHVTEPPVCSSLTRSILASNERAEGIRIPDLEDCVCMIALHIVRSGMYRPLREYIDLMWYLDGMDEAGWQALHSRAARHHLLPALFLSLRQARYCLALDTLAPDRAESLGRRIVQLGSDISALRMRALDWLAPPDYPMRPIESRNHPAFRRSFALGAGTSSAWRVCAAFLSYGAARVADRLTGGDRIGGNSSAAD